MPTKGRQITYEDLEALKRELLNKLAKKKELIRLATKDDLKGLATREEISTLATKIELKKLDEKTDRIIGIIIQMQAQMSGIETKTDAERKFNILMNAIDQLTRKFDNLITEKSAIDHGLIRHESRLDDHEVRIHNLESTH